MRPPSLLTRVESSWHSRDFPMPGGPTTVTKWGRSSVKHLVQTVRKSSSSCERPTSALVAGRRSAGAGSGSTASHAATAPAFPLAETASDF